MVRSQVHASHGRGDEAGRRCNPPQLSAPEAGAPGLCWGQSEEGGLLKMTDQIVAFAFFWHDLDDV